MFRETRAELDRPTAQFTSLLSPTYFRCFDLLPAHSSISVLFHHLHYFVCSDFLQQFFPTMVTLVCTRTRFLRWYLRSTYTNCGRRSSVDWLTVSAFRAPYALARAAFRPKTSDLSHDSPHHVRPFLQTFLKLTILNSIPCSLVYIVFVLLFIFFTRLAPFLFCYFQSAVSFISWFPSWGSFFRVPVLLIFCFFLVPYFFWTLPCLLLPLVAQSYDIRVCSDCVFVVHRYTKLLYRMHVTKPSPFVSWELLILNFLCPCHFFWFQNLNSSTSYLLPWRLIVKKQCLSVKTFIHENYGNLWDRINNIISPETLNKIRIQCTFY